MPAYKALTIPPGLLPGDTYQVWNAETPTPGAGPVAGGGTSASERVALSTKEVGATGLSVTGFFAAAPGVFEIDVQVSDVDIDSQYQTIASGDGGVINAVDATNNTFHTDCPFTSANFARLLMRSRANNAAVTADIRKY